MAINLNDIKYYNPAYLPLFNDKNRYVVMYGGRAGAKSQHPAQEIVMRLCMPEYFKCVLVRDKYNKIKDSNFATVVDWINTWNLNHLFHITTSPLTIVNKYTGNKVIARGLDELGKLKSVQDLTCAWYEEADEIEKEAFIESTLSIRSSKTSFFREYITFNPRNEHTWLNDYFFPEKHSYEKLDGKFHYIKSKRKNTTILHTTYKDNKYCPIEIIELLENLKDDNYSLYKANTLGLWSSVSAGLVYQDWNVIDNVPNNLDKIICVDYGYSNPTAVVELSNNENRLYADEVLYAKGITEPALIERLKDLYGNNPELLFIVDSAQPSLIADMHAKGFYVKPAHKPPNSVIAGISQVKAFDLYVTSKSINIIQELNNYSYKEDKFGRMIDDVIKAYDHALDAIRYGVFTYGYKYWLSQENQNNFNYLTTKSRKLKNVSL
jgi:phage terminase large subunit